MINKVIQSSVIIGILSLILAGCGGDDADPFADENSSPGAGDPSRPGENLSGCGIGTTISVYSYQKPYCIIPRKRGIIEEGFQCPQGSGFVAAYGNLDICGPDDELPEQVREGAKQLVNSNYIPGSACEDRFCTSRGELCTESGGCEEISDSRACMIGCTGGFNQPDTGSICAKDGQFHGQCEMKCTELERADEGVTCGESPSECNIPNPAIDVETSSQTIPFDGSSGEPIRVKPGEDISLTATTENNETNASYSWQLLTRPSETTAQLSSQTGKSISIHGDWAGHYEIELTIGKNDDCAKSLVIPINIVPDSNQIFAQLTWENTLDSPDCRGDLDLHYLHPDGMWNTSPLDIYEDNKTADWGESGSSDDPTLTVGSPNSGMNLENLRHPNPNSNRAYAIGVHFDEIQSTSESESCSDEAVEPEARIEVFMEGQLIYDRAKLLSAPNIFWEVGTVRWSVNQVDETTDGFPDEG